MKKQSILSLVALVAVLLMTSCNKYQAKSADLKTQNDSLNYTLGLANGDGIKTNMMQADTTDQAIVALMKALDEAYKKGGDNKDELYKLGVQIGNSFKQQKAKGLMGDSTLAFNNDLVKQGLVNALNGFDKGMTAKDAEAYIQKTMMEIQAKKMASQPQISAPEQAPQPQVK